MTKLIREEDLLEQLAILKRYFQGDFLKDEGFDDSTFISVKSAVEIAVDVLETLEEYVKGEQNGKLSDDKR